MLWISTSCLRPLRSLRLMINMHPNKGCSTSSTGTGTGSGTDFHIESKGFKPACSVFRFNSAISSCRTKASLAGMLLKYHGRKDRGLTRLLVGGKAVLGEGCRNVLRPCRRTLHFTGETFICDTRGLSRSCFCLIADASWEPRFSILAITNYGNFGNRVELLALLVYTLRTSESKSVLASGILNS